MDMEKLVEQAKSGDRQAQNTLYHRYRQRSYAVCRRITRDKELSEELVDDAFLIALNKLDCLHDPDKFGAWLSAISARLALRQLKRQPDSKPIPISHIEGFDIPCDNHDSPFTHEELQSAIDRLPTGYRQVFTLAVIEGRQHKEIASILNIEPHSSSSQLCHARAMLRRMLGPLMCLLLTTIPFILVQDKHTETAPTTAWMPPMSPTFVPKLTPIPIPAPRDRTIINGTHIHRNNLDRSNLFNTLDNSQYNPSTLKQPDKANQPPFPFSTPSDDKSPDSFLPYNALNGIPTKPLASWFTNKWSIAVSVAPALSNTISSQCPHSLLLPTVSTSGGSEPGIAIDNWRDCKKYVLENSSLFSPEVATALIRIAQSNEVDNNGQIIRTEYHEPPTLIALTIHYTITPALSIYTGISHGAYRSYFQTGVGIDRIDEHQRVTFLDIPLGISYCPHPTSRLGYHLSTDLTLQLPLSLHSNTSFIIGGQTNSNPGISNERIPLLHQSISLNTLNLKIGLKAGVHYHLSTHISLFSEVGISYTFPCWQSVSTYSTLHPFVPSTQVGLRFTF